MSSRWYVSIKVARNRSEPSIISTLGKLEIYNTCDLKDRSVTGSFEQGLPSHIAAAFRISCVDLNLPGPNRNSSHVWFLNHLHAQFQLQLLTTAVSEMLGEPNTSCFCGNGSKPLDSAPRMPVFWFRPKNSRGAPDNAGACSRPHQEPGWQDGARVFVLVLLSLSGQSWLARIYAFADRLASRQAGCFGCIRLFSVLYPFVHRRRFSYRDRHGLSLYFQPLTARCL